MGFKKLDCLFDYRFATWGGLISKERQAHLSQNQEATVHGIRSYISFYFADVTLRREMPFTSMPVLNPIGIRRIHWSDHSFAVYVCIQTSFCSARLSTIGLHVAEEQCSSHNRLGVEGSMLPAPRFLI